ncbi:MAG: AAA family ATPase [Bacillota bacterium]|nr:AAA family ATPase [Bacillota bacterium]
MNRPQTVVERLNRVILGKQDVIEDLVAAILAGGHVLLEDVPGTGKTTLAKALARLLDLDFKRIQFTPDLLPSELTGITYFDQSQSSFVFRPGTVFTQVLLADEINRATPRTQSSLLECMEERQVTVDGETYQLSDPFIVLATENPLEIQGTFPLPEAQLDRFMMRLEIGYPAADAELAMIDSYLSDNPLDGLEPVLDGPALLELRGQSRRIHVGAAVRSYILSIVQATRTSDRLLLGASPRATLALAHAAQARALLEGADFVTPDHVKRVAVPVLAHRVLLRGSQLGRSSDAQRARIRDLLAELPVPTEKSSVSSPRD